MTRAWARWSRRHAAMDGERGSIALWYAIVAVAALVMAGLVIDGGNALATRQRAADVATQAARAGADALNPASLRDTAGGVSLQADPAAAQLAASGVLAAAGATGTVTVAGGTVSVTATIPKRTAILSVVGVTDISQTATASATSIYGDANQQGG